MASVVGGDTPRMKLLCSHGGRLLPHGPDGAIRYVGGETRVLAVPRDVPFRELAGRLSEMAGGAEVRAVRHRLADEALEDVIVSVTCDEELAHMRGEYDRLCATRPKAWFRVFVTTGAASSGGSGKGVVHRGRSPAAGLPPLPPKMRRVQSEQAQPHRRPAYPAPVRRVQSAQEFAGRVHVQPSFHHHRQPQCYCSYQRRDQCAPAPPPARPMYAPLYMSKKAVPPPTPVAKATGRVLSTEAPKEKARNRDTMEERRAIWEFE